MHVLQRAERHCHSRGCLLKDSLKLLAMLHVTEFLFCFLSVECVCVQNAAARLVTGTRKYERGLSRLRHDDLHWLVILQPVQYQLAVTVHPWGDAAWAVWAMPTQNFGWVGHNTLVKKANIRKQ